MRPDDARLLTCAAALLGLVEAVIAETVPVDDGGAYRSDGPLPPRISRGHFNDRCARGDIPGAVKIPGRGRGYWCVAKAAWHSAVNRRPALPALRIVQREVTDAERADAMIKAAGFRLTRTGR